MYPEMLKIRQHLNRDKLAEPEMVLRERILASGLLDTVNSGSRVAITAGSRGIRGIDRYIKLLIDLLKERGAEPFVLAAMGSHGGGTVGGQRAMLDSLGISEDNMGVPVRASENAEQVAVTDSGAAVYVDPLAMNADAVIVMNRAKIHTAFHGAVESGLCKMIAVGLGKKQGAESCHRHGLGEVIVDCFRESKKRLNIAFGVGILENAFDETLDFSIAAPDEFERVDSDLLERSRSSVPGIPFGSFDILIVDEMGKNISGTGMDTNVIGFWRRFGGEKKPDYRTLIVRSLTPESHGNAMGIGLADLIPRSLAENIDFRSTYANAMTSQWSMGRVPITLENDRACCDVALKKHDPDTVRIVRIKNTLDLEELIVSMPLIDQVGNDGRLELIESTGPLAFRDNGLLL